MHRLFAALRPPAAIRASLTAVMGGVPAARWQDDDQLHLTLRFIGEVDRRTAEDVVAALGQVEGAALTAQLAGVGAFDRQGRVDTLWAGVIPPGPLAALHARVDRALWQVGLAPDARACHPRAVAAERGRRTGDPAVAG